MALKCLNLWCLYVIPYLYVACLGWHQHEDSNSNGDGRGGSSRSNDNEVHCWLGCCSGRCVWTNHIIPCLYAITLCCHSSCSNSARQRCTSAALLYYIVTSDSAYLWCTSSTDDIVIMTHYDIQWLIDAVNFNTYITIIVHWLHWRHGIDNDDNDQARWWWQVIYAHISVTRGLADVMEIALRSSLSELHLCVILAMVRWCCWFHCHTRL